MKRDWYVLHTKPRCEKKVALYLEKYKCFFHLPTYVKIRKVQRRKVRRTLPLFPGYVFSRLSPDERVLILKTNHIVHTIYVPHPRRMIHQLRQINRVRRSDAELRVKAKEFKEGDYVRVVTGPFRGTEGYLAHDGSGTHLCMNVSVLGTSVMMQISPDDVEKKDPPS